MDSRKDMNKGDSSSDTRVANLLQQVEQASHNDELIDILARGKNIRVERIVSRGHTSDAHFWYDDPQAEWVTVLSGEARLRFLVDDKVVHLGRGDHITIAPHEKHRVDWTTPEEQTIWLAIYFSPSSSIES
jgi:cupin 2 domain-containing protein